MTLASATSRQGMGTGRRTAAACRTTIIVIDPVAAGALTVHRYRVIDRLRARLLSASLDARLAAGESPETARLLAVRARIIVAPPRRAELARNWEHLLAVARRPAAVPARALPLRREAIIAAAPAIGELASRLRAALPVSARGVAAASTLLTGAGGPLYSRHAPVSLGDALQEALTWLDPEVPLMAAVGSLRGPVARRLGLRGRRPVGPSGRSAVGPSGRSGCTRRRGRTGRPACPGRLA